LEFGMIQNHGQMRTLGVVGNWWKAYQYKGCHPPWEIQH
jgi:hypothetical protein